MERTKKIIKTSVLGIIVNIVLVVFKAIIGIITGSIAIVLDAVNNLTDAISSVVTIVGTKLANRRPDKKHPYGYGRIEYLTSTIVSLIVLMAGITAIKESIEKIISKESAEYTATSLIIIAVAVVVKFFFGKYVKTMGKKLDSESLIASGQDAFMDSILSFTALIGAIINISFGLTLEGYLGVIIACFIIKSAIEMMKDSLSMILGERSDSEVISKIKNELKKYKDVQGVFDLNLNSYGPLKTLGTMHIQVDDDMYAKDIHILTRRIEYDLFEKFGIIFTIGIYAANDKNEYKELYKDILKTCKKYEDIKQVHGFYVDENDKCVYFDIIISFENKYPNKEIANIINELKEKYPKYDFNVILDNDFSD